MRLAFFILVFVNLVFHVWSAGYLGGQDVGREPERLTQQIAPEKIRLVGQSAQSLPAEPIMPPAGTDAKPAATDCRLIGGLGNEEAAALQKELAISGEYSIRPLPGPASTVHWVLIRNLANRAVADKKNAELQQLKVDDGKIVADQNSGPFVVSLGTFPNEKAAHDHLAALNRKGVRSAVIEVREQAGDSTTLEVRAAAEPLTRLPAALAAYAGANLGNCPVAAE